MTRKLEGKLALVTGSGHYTGSAAGKCLTARKLCA